MLFSKLTCCFSATKSRLVQDGIKRQCDQDTALPGQAPSPTLPGWLVPLLGLTVSLFLLITFVPWIFQSLSRFVQMQMSHFASQVTTALFLISRPHPPTTRNFTSAWQKAAQ